MDDEMMMKGGVERSANPSIERMLKVFEFALPKPGEICKHLAGAYCSTTGKPTRSFATERVSLDSV
jgi:hypothetical protein